jgi:hypothetical protein
METSRWAAALVATVMNVSCIQTSQAQAQSMPTQPNQSMPLSASTPMPGPTVGTPRLGQDQTVTYNNKFAGIGFGKTISKTVTIEPGNHQISLDGLKNLDKINLTLVNPSATPLQFETTQRWGKQVVAIIPAHSQQVVSFTKARPLTHEIRYFVMQQPSNAISSNEDYVAQQAGAVADVEYAAIKSDLDQQTALMRQSQEQQTAQLQEYQKSVADEQKAVIDDAIREYQSQGRSAVRGYW